MNDLNDIEISYLKNLIFQKTAYRIKDKEEIEKLSSIYFKLFSTKLKNDYLNWVEMNNKLLGIK